ncbi:MAG: GTP-binding protein LepA [Flavobacteriaceae bacterium]
MTTYMAQFIAKHRIIQIEQSSIFTWRQESGEIDESLLADKIKRESAVHFYKLVAGANYEVAFDDISISVSKTMVFSG